MAGSKAARVPNVWDTLRNQNNQINRDFALSRRVFNPQTIAIPPSPEIPPAGKSGSDSGNALETAGGTMIGPIAYFPIALFIKDLAIGKAASATSRVLDISGPIGAASSRILANGGVGTTLLEFIKGGQYAGQQLNIQGTLTQTLTIKNDLSSNGSEGLNIRTQTGGDLTLDGNANVLLVFDVTSNQWAVISSGSGGSGSGGNAKAALMLTSTGSTQVVAAGPPVLLDVFDITVIADGVTVNTTTNSLIPLATGRYAFGLNLNLSADVNNTTADFVLVVNGVPLTNANSVFLRGFGDNDGLYPTAPFDFTADDVLTIEISHDKGVDVTFTFQECGFYLFKLEAGGGAGADSLGQLSDVAISPDPPIANDILQFSTTSGLWENQPASAGGGLLTDLSNLAAGAIPPVDMSLNNFDLENVTDIRMNAAGTGLIDNIQHLDFFQFNHNIQSFGDRMEIQVDSTDIVLFKIGTTDAARVAQHGLEALDIRFPIPDAVTGNTYQIVQQNNNMTFNVPDTRGYSWRVNDTSQMSLSASGTLNVSQVTAAIQLFLVDNPGFAAFDGSIGNVSNDVIIGSGGNAVNVTDLFNNTNSGQFADDTFNIFNAADPTKVALFSANAIATGTSRIFSFQNASGTLAMLDGATQNFSVNVGFGNNSLQDVGGIFTTAGLSDIGQNTNYFDDLFINQIFFFGDPSLEYKIGGNIINGFDFVVPNFREFEFYFDGTGTTPSWAISETAIGTNGGQIAGLKEIQFDGSGSVNAPGSTREIGFDGNSCFVNIPTGARFDLYFGGDVEWNFSAGLLTGDNILLNNTLTFNASVSAPLTGQIVRNGDDLLVSTTEGVKNMKDIGGEVTGVIESALWTDGETAQFDFFVWHSNSNNAGESSGSAVNMLQNVLYYVPFFIGKEVSIIRMGLRISAAAGTYTIAGGIYSNRTDGQNYPATLVAQSSQIQSGAGFKTVLFGGQDLTPGLYWLAFNHTGGPANITIDGYARGNCISIGWKEDGSSLDPMTGYFQGHSSSSLPATPDDEMGIIFDLTPLDTNAHFIRFTT